MREIPLLSVLLSLRMRRRRRPRQHMDLCKKNTKACQLNLCSALEQIEKQNRKRRGDTIKVFLHTRYTKGTFFAMRVVCVSVFLNSNAGGILSSSLSRRKLFFNILERLRCVE